MAAAFFSQLGASVVATLLGVAAAYMWKAASKPGLVTGEDKLVVFELLVAAAALLVARTIQSWVVVGQLEDANQLRDAAWVAGSRTLLLAVIWFIGQAAAHYIKHYGYMHIGGSAYNLPEHRAVISSRFAAVALLAVFLIDFFLPAAIERWT